MTTIPTEQRLSDALEALDIAVDILTNILARDAQRLPQVRDRDAAVRRLIRNGAEPEALDKHISTAVRGELESGRLGPQEART